MKRRVKTLPRKRLTEMILEDHETWTMIRCPVSQYQKNWHIIAGAIAEFGGKRTTASTFRVNAELFQINIWISSKGY